MRGKIWVNNHAHVLKAKGGIVQDFIFYALVHKDILPYLAGGTRAKLNRGELNKIKYALPPLPEQRAIAEALSDVDGLLGSLEALIAKKRAIKQAAMQQFLTGNTRLPGFSGPWETKRLGEIGEISGSGVDKKICRDEIPVRLLNYLDVYHKRFLRSDDLTQLVSAKPDQARRCAVEKGDVFFTPTSEVPDDIGRAAVVIENAPDGVYSYHLVRLRITVPWDLRFRAYVFASREFLDQASKASEGSGTRYVVTLPRFRALAVLHPSDPNEQAAIAAVLSDMDAEIDALERRAAKTRAIKQGMMQQLLTGRVRLVGSS
jgi:type I restriction enzyme S subunit